MAEINKISSDIGDQRQFNSPFDNSRSKKCFKLLRGTGISSRPITEVKQRRAWIVFGWVTIPVSTF